MYIPSVLLDGLFHGEIQKIKREIRDSQIREGQFGTWLQLLKLQNYLHYHKDVLADIHALRVKGGGSRWYDDLILDFI